MEFNGNTPLHCRSRSNRSNTRCDSRSVFEACISASTLDNELSRLGKWTYMSL